MENKLLRAVLNGSAITTPLRFILDIFSKMNIINTLSKHRTAIGNSGHS